MDFFIHVLKKWLAIKGNIVCQTLSYHLAKYYTPGLENK